MWFMLGTLANIDCFTTTIVRTTPYYCYVLEPINNFIKDLATPCDVQSSVLRFGLIDGRHPLPVESYIFDSVEDVHDYTSIERRIREWLHDNVIGTDVDRIVIYMTGLGTVVTSFLKMWGWAMASHDLPLMDLAHYDSFSDDYNIQPWNLMLE